MRQPKRQVRQKEVSKDVIAKKVIDHINAEDILAENLTLKEDLSSLRTHLELLEMRVASLDKELSTKTLALDKANDKLLISGSGAKETTVVNTTDEMIVYKNKELQSVDAVKLFNAIRSEESNQNRKDVKLSRKEMVSLYNVNESKVTTIRNALSQHGFIEVTKRDNGYCFEILKDLPIL